MTNPPNDPAGYGSGGVSDVGDLPRILTPQANPTSPASPEADLPMLRRIAEEGLPFAIDVVDGSEGTGRCYLDLADSDSGVLYRIELTRET